MTEGEKINRQELDKVLNDKPFITFYYDELEAGVCKVGFIVGCTEVIRDRILAFITKAVLDSTIVQMDDDLKKGKLPCPSIK